MLARLARRNLPSMTSVSFGNCKNDHLPFRSLTGCRAAIGDRLSRPLFAADIPIALSICLRCSDAAAHMHAQKYWVVKLYHPLEAADNSLQSRCRCLPDY